MKLRCSGNQLTPANMLFVRTGCRFRKVTRSEPGPAPSTVPKYTLCIYRYIEETPARLCSSFSACVCTTIVLHPRTILLASLEYQSSPSSTSCFKWMRRSADASQSVSQSVNRDTHVGLKHPGWAISLPHNMAQRPPELP